MKIGQRKGEFKIRKQKWKRENVEERKKERR